MPWPKYPCHSCSDRWVHGDCRHRPQRPFCYAEADGYYWHTAMWDLISGRWRATCCEGHVVRGRA